MNLHLSISNGFVFSKIYDKRGDFDFDILSFPFLYGDVPHRPSYEAYIVNLKDLLECGFNARNKSSQTRLSVS